MGQNSNGWLGENQHEPEPTWVRTLLLYYLYINVIRYRGLFDALYRHIMSILLGNFVRVIQ